MKSLTRPLRSRSIDIDPALGWILYRGKKIPLSIKRSSRTTFGISVYPDQSVIMRLPERADDATAFSFLEKKSAWIYRQLLHFDQFLPHTPERRFVGGETHFYLGKPYRLRIREGKRIKVDIRGRYIVMETPDTGNTEKIRKGYQRWLRERALEAFTEVHRELEPLHSIHLGYWLPEPTVKSFKRIWARYESKSQTYAVNFQLVRASRSSIEYVILHEICHHKYPLHDQRFYALLRSRLPDWEERKLELEKMMT